MQMLYNSDSFVVVQFLTGTEGGVEPAVEAGVERDRSDAHHSALRRGYEIVDKLAGKEIFLQGAVAESFQRGVEALVQQGPREEDLDAFIAGFTVLAQQPVVLH